MSDTINTQMTTQDYPMNGEPGDIIKDGQDLRDVIESLLLRGHTKEEILAAFESIIKERAKEARRPLTAYQVREELADISPIDGYAWIDAGILYTRENKDAEIDTIGECEDGFAAQQVIIDWRNS